MERLRRGELDLPVVSPGVARLLRVRRGDKGIESSSLHKIIEQEPRITLKILKTANSAQYSRGFPIRDLKTAYAQLGHDRLLGIAQTVAIESFFKVRSPVLQTLLNKLWNQTITTAHLSSILAGSFEGADPPEIYLLALFHNTGEMAMARHLSPGLDLADPRAMDWLSDLTLRRHQGVGAALLKSWQLDPEILLMAGHHHTPERLGGSDLTRKAHLINLAYRMALAHGLRVFPKANELPSKEESQALLGISKQALDEAWTEVERMARR